MKSFPSNVRLLAISIGALAVSAGAAMAQNNNNNLYDLELTIWNPNGANSSNTMIVSLGNTASVFRDATANSFTSIVNIGSALSTNFGGSWADTTNLWVGAIGNIGTSTNTSLTQNSGDPFRTLYYTKARTSVGTVGTTSTSTSVSSGSATTVASNSNTIFNLIETGASTQIASFTTVPNAVTNQNAVNGSNVQQTGYGGISGGTQAAFTTGNYGTFGTVANTEIMLDLFRVQFVNNISGQYGNGSPNQTGQFLGTITIDNAGAVGFTAVPEPSTYALLAISAAIIFFVVRRRSAKMAA